MWVEGFSVTDHVHIHLLPANSDFDISKSKLINFTDYQKIEMLKNLS